MAPPIVPGSYCPRHWQREARRLGVRPGNRAQSSGTDPQIAPVCRDRHLILGPVCLRLFQCQSHSGIDAGAAQAIGASEGEREEPGAAAQPVARKEYHHGQAAAPVILVARTRRLARHQGWESSL